VTPAVTAPQMEMQAAPVATPRNPFEVEMGRPEYKPILNEPLPRAGQGLPPITRNISADEVPPPPPRRF
jgi:hypothetical protein